MIQSILNLLAQHPYYNVSERVEIAKGKYELISNWKRAKEKIKRLWLRK